MTKQKTYEFLQKSCKQHKVFPKQILELNCKNGEILSFFSEHSKIYGIENSKDKIEKAKQKNPNWKFYNQNISNFRIPFQWQLIYCVNTTFNQLTKYSDREKIFQKTIWHLEPYGLFIFRIYTEKYYQNFENKISIIEKEKNYTITQTKKTKTNIFNTSNKFFSLQKDNIYLLSEHTTSEISIPISQIRKSLQQYFENIFITNTKGQKSKSTDKEIYFICQKWWE